MPRLFTGLEVPSEVAASLALFRGGLPGARWIDPENYHITLRFIGDIDGPTAHDIYDMLGDVRRKPVTVTLDMLSTFGGGKPRAVFARAVPSAELAELQADHERRVRRAGLPPESRKFTPHVTLARLRDAAHDYAPSTCHPRLLPQHPVRCRTVRPVFSRDSVGGGLMSSRPPSPRLSPASSAARASLPHLQTERCPALLAAGGWRRRGAATPLSMSFSTMATNGEPAGPAEAGRKRHGRFERLEIVRTEAYTASRTPGDGDDAGCRTAPGRASWRVSRRCRPSTRHRPPGRSARPRPRPRRADDDVAQAVVADRPSPAMAAAP
jgi:2'-5' RNA ligase